MAYIAPLFSEVLRYMFLAFVLYIAAVGLLFSVTLLFNRKKPKEASMGYRRSRGRRRGRKVSRKYFVSRGGIRL